MNSQTVTAQTDQTQSSDLLYLRNFQTLYSLFNVKPTKDLQSDGVIHFLSQNSLGQEEQRRELESDPTYVYIYSQTVRVDV